MTQSRQLAAIMFTDIVGYTALMGRDSIKALELVRISKEIQKPLVEKHHGQWLKEMGDGALVKFSTALDAVNCAIDIQKTARAELDSKLRIGIHLGDITIENNDVYGDGVNVASRLESIADPGGIYISDAIEKAIRGQSDIQAKYLGESRLKNVDYGVRTYAVQGVGLPIPEVKEDKELSGQFQAELQRRGVIRAGVTYVVLSLLLILLLQYTSSLISLPTWSSTALLGILIAGFPAALYFAWNYERSPEGFVKTTSQQSWQNPLSPSQRKPFTGTFIIVGLVLVIAIMFLYPRFQSSGQEPETSESVLESRIIDKSIVVLPFTNISSDPEQEYFSDGMMEEILNHLVKIEDLKVISRTTAMQYKGTTKSVHEITEELNVATALEGSVRKDGDQVRITVQLIEGDSDTHLWSESYDRELTNIFKVQSDVAQQVAQVLKAEISPEVKLRIESQPTTNIEAYNLFLQAEAQVKAGSHLAGIKLVEEAIAIDPEFANAYAELGYWKTMWWREDLSLEPFNPAEAVRIAIPYYEKALEIDPDNSAAHFHKAQMHLWYQWDFEAAESEYRIAKQLNPGANFGGLLGATGRFEELLKSSEQSLIIDPLSPYTWAFKIQGLHHTNQPEKALQTIDEAQKLYDIIINQSGLYTLTMLTVEVYSSLGMYEEVIEAIEVHLGDSQLPQVLGSQAIAYYHLGERNKFNELIEEMKTWNATGASPSYFLGMIYAEMGAIDTAFELLQKAYEDHEVYMYGLKEQPYFEPLHTDPRWQQMLDKVGFPE